jgi:hypothetical protein
VILEIGERPTQPAVGQGESGRRRNPAATAEPDQSESGFKGMIRVAGGCVGFLSVSDTLRMRERKRNGGFAKWRLERSVCEVFESDRKFA